MHPPSKAQPVISAGPNRAQPEGRQLTASESFILARLRLFDRGRGCALTMRELGEGDARSLSERQTRRTVKSLEQQGLVRDGGRIEGNGPRVLFVEARNERAA